MYQFITIFTLVLVVANAVTDVDWAVFKAKYSKVYNSSKEDDYRRKIYESNMEKVQEHNILFAKRLKSFFLKENEYADMTHVEFVKTMNGLIPSSPNDLSENIHRANTTASLPREVNWVKRGYVTDVKNQGGCGSCWAFVATGAIEGAHKKAKGVLTSLSEQNLIDCSSKYGNHGCNGGMYSKAFKYVIDTGGIDTEDSYPYKAREGWCHFSASDVGARISSYKMITQNSERDLKEATANVGPIAVSIDASLESFMLYGGGIYDDPRCSKMRVNHGVLVVGYGEECGDKYWRVKNSWGPTWGEHGYILMSRDKNNQCGIARQASYPMV